MGTVARGTGTPPGLTPSAFPCALLPAGPVVWARSRGPPQPCRAGGTLPAVTLGTWPPPGPPSRLDRCCWIDSRTLARLGAPSLPPGSGVGAGAPAWTKPWGLPPPACTQLRTASPPAPPCRVGAPQPHSPASGPPPAPSGPAQTLRGDKPRCCSGGGPGSVPCPLPSPRGPAPCRARCGCCPTPSRSPWVPGGSFFYFLK